MTITEQNAQPPTWQQLKAEREDANRTEALILASRLPAGLGTPAWDELVEGITKALYEAEDRGPDRPRVIPELLHVHGYALNGTMQVIADDEVSVYRAEGHDVDHGLQCPHCGTVTWNGHDGGIYVIDVAERWSDFGYEVSMVDEYEPLTAAERMASRGLNDWKPTGRQVERRAIVGGWGDGDFHTQGHACTACTRRVALPDDVEEVGD